LTYQCRFISVVAAMKLNFLIALVLVSSGSAAQTGGISIDSPHDFIRMPESGPMVVPGGGASTGPNFRNLSVSPLPGSREEMDEIMRRPNEAQLPAQEIRPVPGSPLPPMRRTR
jgi:hypothetical protein